MFATLTQGYGAKSAPRPWAKKTGLQPVYNYSTMLHKERRDC